MDLAELTTAMLKNDGYEDIYLFLHSTDEASGNTYLEFLRDGTRAADIPFSGGYICHMAHFHHPWSHRGYLSATSAADLTTRVFTMAVEHWQNGAKDTAIYHLGRALHLIQDIFIPHHAGISAVKGHGQLEQWLMEHWEQYQVFDGGYYHWEKTFSNQDDCHHVTSEKLYDWIDYGSHISIDWYNKHFADGNYQEDNFSKLAPHIIANALRLSAGYIFRFFNHIA